MSIRHDIILVDGSNVYNSVAAVVGKHCASDPTLAICYLREWFDFDRLLYSTLSAGKPPKRGFWLFHSRKPLGSGACRLDQRFVDGFWARQSLNPGCLTSTVELAGEQQETFPFACYSCGKENEAASNSEKGLDASIICHLFESEPTWDSACIVANDTDYAPVVRALTRRGKIITCVGRRTLMRVNALQRSSHFFVDLDSDFLRADVEAFAMFKPDGVLDRALELLTQIPLVRAKGFSTENWLSGQLNKHHAAIVIKHAKEDVNALRVALSPLLEAECGWWSRQPIWKALNDTLTALAFVPHPQVKVGLDRYLESNSSTSAWKIHHTSVERVGNV